MKFRYVSPEFLFEELSADDILMTSKGTDDNYSDDLDMDELYDGEED